MIFIKKHFWFQDGRLYLPYLGLPEMFSSPTDYCLDAFIDQTNEPAANWTTRYLVYLGMDDLPTEPDSEVFASLSIGKYQIFLPGAYRKNEDTISKNKYFYLTNLIHLPLLQSSDDKETGFFSSYLQIFGGFYKYKARCKQNAAKSYFNLILTCV